MKAIAVSLLMASMTLAVHAIERPADASSVPPPLPEKTVAENTPPPLPEAPKNSVWMGIIPVPVPEALVAQLELNGNPGVLVKSVGPESPAAKAGVKKHDIILSINEIPIREGADIAKSISKSKPGDKAILHMIRGSQPIDVTVPLESAPAHLTKIDGIMADGAGLEAPQKPGAQTKKRTIPTDLSRQMTEHMKSLDQFSQDWEEEFSELEKQLNDLMLPLAERLPEDIKSSQEHLQSMLKTLDPNATPSFSMNQSNTFQFNIQDESGAIRLSRVNDQTNLKATDAAGKVIFDGPYNTDEEKAAVPQNIREKIDKISFQRR